MKKTNKKDIKNCNKNSSKITNCNKTNKKDLGFNETKSEYDCNVTDEYNCNNK